ncbi:hypothetical protein J6590_020328 [Homalodisca vitripennis]|nr:hypothetical protein J6590_020328 [Homalodisca vitripennis]
MQIRQTVATDCHSRLCVCVFSGAFLISLPDPVFNWQAVWSRDSPHSSVGVTRLRGVEESVENKTLHASLSVRPIAYLLETVSLNRQRFQLRCLLQKFVEIDEREITDEIRSTEASERGAPYFQLLQISILVLKTVSLTQ